METLVILSFFFAVLFGTSADMIGDRQVKVFETRVNWFRAFDICAANGMQLLIIRNEEENDQAIKLAQKYKLPKEDFWLGANNLGNTEFIWTATGEPVDQFTRWFPGQPNKGLENCLARSTIFLTTNKTDYTWHDYACIVKFPFICQESECTYKMNPSKESPAYKCAENAVQDVKGHLNRLQATLSSQGTALENNLRVLFKDVLREIQKHADDPRYSTAPLEVYRATIDEQISQIKAELKELRLFTSCHARHSDEANIFEMKEELQKIRNMIIEQNAGVKGCDLLG